MQTLKKGNSEEKKNQAEKDLERNLEYINEIDKRLANTFHAIEADTYAFSMVQVEYKDKYDFVQDPSGLAREIGRVNNRPIMLSFRWWIINGHPVLFYGCDSQLADWKMIEDWLQRHMPHIKHRANAENSRNVLNYCQKVEVKKIELPIRIVKCYACMDSKQVEVRRIGYDSIMGPCTNCR